MAIKLIGDPRSTATLRVIATLHELDIPFEIEVPDWPSLKFPEYLATKHPFGKIPVLIDDGYRIYESRAIARHLVNKYQSTKSPTVLLPQDVHKQGMVEQAISVEYSYYDKAVHKLISELMFKAFHGASPDPVKVEEACKEIVGVLDVYEKILDGQDYIANNEFSIADIFHLPTTHYALKTEKKDLFNDPSRPNVTRWLSTIMERPSWKKSSAAN